MDKQQEANSGLYIGALSGTSIDGFDVVLTKINGDSVELLHHLSYDIPLELTDALHTLCTQDQVRLEALATIDISLGHVISKAINQLVEQSPYKAEDIKAIGSHGQTVRHQPDAQHPFSLQLGNANVIAQQCDITTVADFRMADVAANGQGAPLATAFHHAVFTNKEEDRAIINLGGISNVTWLPKEPVEKIIGYDIGPANTLMDYWTRKHLDKAYDLDGEWARSGCVSKELLNDFLSEPYFQQPSPKSTGRELFNQDWLDERRTLLETSSPKDVQRTLLELTAKSIADNIIRFEGNNSKAPAAVYLCGGGTRNLFLFERLQALLPNHKIATTDALGLDPQWVEGCTFAWLAYRTMNGLSGNLPSVTGASRSKILGGIYQA